MADSNPTFVYVTGPVHAFVRIPPSGSSPYNVEGSGASGVPWYLGSTETKPEIDGADVWAPYHNAIGGDMVPFDHTFQGSIETIRLDLSKYSQSVLNVILDSPNYGRRFDNAQGGYHGVGDIGRLLLGNAMSYELWLVNHHWWWANQALNINAFPDLPPGMYYRACKTNRKFRGRDGVTPSMFFLEVEAVRSYDAYWRAFFLKSPDPSMFQGLPDPL